MNRILTFSFLFISSFLISQPIILKEWSPKPGDNRKEIYLDGSVDVGPAGANQTWDFTDLDGLDQEEMIVFNFLDPSDTPYDTVFPLATVVVNFLDPEYPDFPFWEYYEQTSESFRTLGVGSDFALQKYDDPFDFAFVGLNFGETVEDTYSGYVESMDFPSWFWGNVSYEYDAYGTLILPDRTIENAIRIREFDVEIDSSEFSGITTIRIDTLEAYLWIGEGSLFPVVLFSRSVSYSESFFNGISIGVNFEGESFTLSYSPLVGSTSTNDLRKPNFEVFPTLAKESIFIHLKDTDQGDLVILNTMGQIISNIRSSQGENILSVPVGYLTPGSYLISDQRSRPEMFVKQ